LFDTVQEAAAWQLVRIEHLPPIVEKTSVVGGNVDKAAAWENMPPVLSLGEGLTGLRGKELEMD
jgi:hypothetical protein